MVGPEQEGPVLCLGPGWRTPAVLCLSATRGNKTGLTLFLFVSLYVLLMFRCFLCVCSGGADAPFCLSRCSVGFGLSWSCQHSHTVSILSHGALLDPPGPQPAWYVAESCRWMLDGVIHTFITVLLSKEIFTLVKSTQEVQKSCRCR